MKVEWPEKLSMVSFDTVDFITYQRATKQTQLRVEGCFLFGRNKSFLPERIEIIMQIIKC